MLQGNGTEPKLGHEFPVAWIDHYVDVEASEDDPSDATVFSSIPLASEAS